MKIQVKSYTFNPATGTIAFNDFEEIRLDSLLLITNVTRGQIIYNFASPALGATVQGNVLTLICDTSEMNAGDSLQIFYEDGTVNPTLDETTEKFNEDVIWLLRRMVKMLESGTVVDAQMRQRVIVDSGSLLLSSYPVTGGGFNVQTTGAPVQGSTMYVQPTWAGPIDPRWTNIEQARISYNTGIRNNLIFN
jgi:hypothetical protein